MMNLNKAEILIAKSETQRWMLSDPGGSTLTCARRIVNCIKFMKSYLGVQQRAEAFLRRLVHASTYLYLYLLRYRSQQPLENYPFLYFNTTMVEGHNR